MTASIRTIPDDHATYDRIKMLLVQEYERGSKNTQTYIQALNEYTGTFSSSSTWWRKHNLNGSREAIGSYNCNKAEHVANS